MGYPYSIAVNLQTFSNNYDYIILNYTLELLHQCLLHSFISLLFSLVMQSVNGAQFLNITFLFVSLGAADVPVFGTIIVSLTSMYSSL